MKIIFLVGDMPQGGSERQVVNLAAILHSHGHETVVIKYGPNNFFEKTLSDSNIPIITIAARKKLIRFFVIRRTIRREHPDALIAFTMTPMLYALLSGLGGGFHVIVSMRCVQESSYTGRFSRILHILLPVSEAIVCNSENERSLWIKHWPETKEKLHVIYNLIQIPVSNVKYIPLKNGKLHILIAARLTPVKNADGLIKALAMLEAVQIQKLQIDWYGTDGSDPIYESNVHDKIRRNNLDDILILHSPVKDIYNIMAQTDIVALFSKSEGLPNAICEGMILGKPIVMTRVSDYWNMVDDDNGFLCDSEDAVSIAVALRKALQLIPEIIMQMGNNSQRKALTLFDENKVAEQWKKLVE